MYQLVYGSLSRQAKGLELLGTLLREEYQVICDRKMDDVAAYEFSIQELIRQLVNEKEFVLRLLGGVRVREYAKTLSVEEGNALLEMIQCIDRNEQNSSRQANRNTQLSLGLLDQNEKTLQELFKQAVPDKTVVYGRKGSMRQMSRQGALISGRL